MKAWSKEFVDAFQRWYAARPRYHRTERLDLIGNSAVTIRDYGTIVHKRKLVLELMQRGFPTNRPLQWLALYCYLQAAHAWAGGTFFQLCCSFCQFFWFRREIGFWCYLCTLSTIQLWHCVSFCFLWEIVFGVTYVLRVHTIQLCGCVSFLVVAGNSSQNENTFWLFPMRNFYKKILLRYFIIIR